MLMEALLDVADEACGRTKGPPIYSESGCGMLSLRSLASDVLRQRLGQVISLGKIKVVWTSGAERWNGIIYKYESVAYIEERGIGEKL
jgi:hypothetical protein